MRLIISVRVFVPNANTSKVITLTNIPLHPSATMTIGELREDAEQLAYEWKIANPHIQNVYWRVVGTL